MNMENTMKMYITADEVAELLGVSRGYMELMKLGWMYRTAEI